MRYLTVTVLIFGLFIGLCHVNPGTSNVAQASSMHGLDQAHETCHDCEGITSSTPTVNCCVERNVVPVTLVSLENRPVIKKTLNQYQYFLPQFIKVDTLYIEAASTDTPNDRYNKYTTPVLVAKSLPRRE